MYSYETSDRKRCHHKAKLHYTHLLSICMPAYISLSSVDQSLVYSLTTSTNSKQTRRSTLSDSTVVSPAPPWLIFAPNTAKHLVLTVLWQSLDRFSHDFQHLAKTLSGQNQTTFFSMSKSVLSPSCILWRWVRSESHLFEPPSYPRKSSETKSLTFLLQPICYLLGRFGEDRLSAVSGLGDTVT